MKDQYKTKKQLLEELEILRNQLAEPKKQETKRKPAKEPLRNSEETFRVLADNAYDGILVTIGEGLHAYANKRASEITGYSLAELLKSSIKDLVHPDESEKIVAKYKKRLAGEPTPHQYETVFIRKGGKSLPIELTAAKTVWHGQPAVLVMIRDITERKQSEQILRESEEKYRNLVERANDGIVIGQDGILRYVNPRLAHMGGYTVEELTGAPIFDFFFPEERAKFVDRYKRRLAGEDVPTIYETTVKHKNGSRIEVEINAGVISYNGKPADLVLLRDITERKKAEVQIERTLRETRLRLEISQALASAQTEEEVLDVLIQHAGLYLKAFVVIFTFDRREGELAGIVRRQNPFESGLTTVVSIGGDLPVSRYTLFGRLSADRPFVSEDVGTDERIEPAGREILRQTGAASFAMFPLSVGNEWMGLILAMAKSTNYFDEEKQHLYQTLAEQGAVALRALRLRAQIRESQQRFQGLVETLSDWIWEVDQNGVYTYVSPKVRDLLGYEPEEVLGKTLFDLIPPEEAERVKSAFEWLQAAQQPIVVLEKTCRHKDGRLVVFETSGAPFFDAEGKLKGYRGVDRDVTEHRRTEEALRESELKYRTILESIDDGYFEVDLAGNIRFFNEAMCRIHGRSRDELMGLNNREFQSPETAKRIYAIFNKVYRTGIPARIVDYEVIRKDGSVAMVEESVLLLRNASGEPIGFYGVSRDRTEQKKAEEALRQSEERYRTILEDIEEGYFEVDLTGRSTFFNDSMCRIHGYPREELLGMDNRRFVDKKNAKKAFEAFNQVYRTGEPGRLFDYEIIRKDGTKRQVEVFPSLRKDSSGRPIGFRGIVRDITERKQAEEALRQSEETAKRLAQENAIIAKIGRIVSSTLNIEEIYEHFAEEVKKLIPFDRIAINTINYDDETFTIAYVTGVEVVNRSKGTAIPLVGSVAGEVSRTRKSMVIQAEDPKKLTDRFPGLLVSFQAGIRSLMAIPLISKDEVVGSFHLHSMKPNAYREKDLRLAEEVGNQIAGAISNAQLFLERKKAEEALRQSEERYRTILEDIEEGYFEIDLTGRANFVNDSLCKIYGYPREEFLGTDNRRFVDRENAKKAFEAFNRVYRTGEPGRLFNYEIIRKDGTKRQVEVYPSLRKDSSGRPIGFRGITRDVTERKHTEELLQREREISLSILENAPYGVALIYKGGQYIYINPEFTNITGYTLQDIPTGTDWFRKAFPDPRDMERMIQFWKEDRSKGKMINREFGIHCKDGKIREIDIRSTFLRDGRAVIVLHDVTEQKLAEERMESLQEQLRQSQKMEAIGRLAGGIAHDFNNLLTIIKGYSQLSLIELKEDTVLKRNIAHIHTATDRAADLVRQLLAFSRRQILEMKVWDLNIILINLHNMLRRLIGEDIELVTLLAEDLGRVKTDLGWIEQAIMNLVVNARDAMPSGGKLTIETGNADLDEAHVDGRVGVKPGRYVMLSVTDTGVGMTPEVRERLFEPFFSTKEKDKGTGLGLSTVYGIVKQSGGDIWVYSEPGKGSTFKIYLPRVDEPLEERREKVLGDELLRGSETILLVEDEEEVRKLAIRVLERQGYKVLAARNGEEAMLICKQHKDPIHLMLTDVVMPVMNGHEVAKRLESLHPETKVLYMSGYTDNAIVLHGVLVKGVHYIQKPFTVDALAKKVREVLDQ